MSRLTAMHTIADLKNLATGELDPEEAGILMHSMKKGLTPVQYACLTAAVQTGRLLELVETEQTCQEEPTQADRIEALLGSIVTLLEHQDIRLSAIERALGRRSA